MMEKVIATYKKKSLRRQLQKYGGSRKVKKMIDVHAHILPGLDDGPSYMEETLQMLEMAAQEGIGTVIATPHASDRFPGQQPEVIRELVQRVSQEAQENGISLSLYPGQEIFYTEETAERLRRGELLTMAGSRYVLLEFYPGALYVSICRAVEELVQKGYIPILAHIERYEVLAVDDRIEGLKKKGACMQMNFRSASGSIFNKKAQRCRKLLKEEKIDFLGTDMHNTSSRSPRVWETVQWLQRKTPERYQRRLFRKNPGSILTDEKLR